MKLHSLCFAPLTLVFFAGLFAACSTPGFVMHCEDSGPILDRGKETGFEFCMGGPDHRPKILACPILEPLAGECPLKVEFPGQCNTSADCAGYLGPTSCLVSNDTGLCLCHSSCITDADCGEGNLCHCDSFISFCQPAHCRSDADCDEGRLCIETRFDLCVSVGFACQSGADECILDQDCPVAGSTCLYEDGHRACSPDRCKS